MATEHWPQHPTPDDGMDWIEWAKAFSKAKHSTEELGFHESLADLDKACKATESVRPDHTRVPGFVRYDGKSPPEPLSDRESQFIAQAQAAAADRDAWAARCAALMTEKDGLATELAEEVLAYEEMLAMKNAWADRALTAEKRLAERDRPLLLATRNPPT